MFNAYAQWRLRPGIWPALHEERRGPSERLLQVVWFHQRLLRDQFRTLDGRCLHVLHPGYWNHEAGPDFRDAVVQFDADPPRTGDVELDLASSGWHAHKHDQNPAYRKVILHAVWEGGGKTPLPTLVLKPVLDSPWEELAQWLGSESSFPKALAGQCSAPLRELSPEQLGELLRQAAWVRFRSKAAQFQARARQAGWEQALWEGLFRALGYKHNVWPMQRLAELRSRWAGPELVPTAAILEARLLGVAGLLPGDLARVKAAGELYSRRIWDDWWREREGLNDCILPSGLWRFSGVRPANHPQRRLALAARWCLQGDLMARLERWCSGAVELPDFVGSLSETLQVPPDEFWSWHWTLRSGRLPEPHALIGATRVTDLAVNVVLPWLWVRTLEGKNQALQEKLERRFFAWPMAEDNTVLRLARSRLLGSRKRLGLGGAAAQQGLLQVVKDYCDHSNSLCEQCRFPQLVREWPL